MGESLVSNPGTTNIKNALTTFYNNVTSPKQLPTAQNSISGYLANKLKNLYINSATNAAKSFYEYGRRNNK